VADSDHTLTEHGQWDAIRDGLLTKEQRAEAKAMIDEYFRHPTHREEHRLVFHPAACLRDNRVTRRRLHKLALSLGIREGAKELFDSFDREQTVVISFGIWDIVITLLSHHSIQTEVLAARLKFDGKDRVVTVDPDSIVVASEKGRWMRDWMKKHRAHPSRVMVVGDDPKVDGKMFLTHSINFLVRGGNGKIRSSTLTEKHWERLTGIASDLKVLAHLRGA
jgi:phosphoserine phosphatase